jgi:hypothetical protein
MPSVLQLQEAKARLSQVVTAAMNGEPQIITKRSGIDLTREDSAPRKDIDL